jgi:LAO/AO transport system kinase
MYETIDQNLKDSFYNNPDLKKMIDKYDKDILEDKISSFKAARTLLEKYFSGRRD